MLDLYAEGSRGIQVHQLRRISPRKDRVGHPRYPRKRRLEDLQLLFIVESQCEPRKISTGARHADDKVPFTGSPPTENTIGMSAVACLAAQVAPVARGNDEVDLLPNEIGCEVGQLIRVSESVARTWHAGPRPSPVPHRVHKGLINRLTRPLSRSQSSEILLVSCAYTGSVAPNAPKAIPLMKVRRLTRPEEQAAYHRTTCATRRSLNEFVGTSAGPAAGSTRQAPWLPSG